MNKQGNHEESALLGSYDGEKGEADGMVAGAVNSTANTLPALQILKTAPDVKMVSAFFIMCVPDCGYGHNGTFLYADSGLVENPNAEELSEIAVCSEKHLRTLWRLRPKLQCFILKFWQCKSELVDKVGSNRLAKAKAPDMLIDGELQVDAAIVPQNGHLRLRTAL